MSKDVLRRQQNRYYFKNETLDFYVGWLLGYAQIAGISPGSLYFYLDKISPATPKRWVTVFAELAEREALHAESSVADGCNEVAQQQYLASACAARAALQLAEPGSRKSLEMLTILESCFMKAMVLLHAPIEPLRIGFKGKYLPAYISKDCEKAKVLFVVIGGGDTYREDLWYFGGKAALEHGYAVLMVDLPGQGSTPNQGLFFSEDTLFALDTTLQAVRSRGFSGKTIMTGWSGGGFFTAKYIEMFGKIEAWIASTPIYDIEKVFEAAMPQILHNQKGLLARGALKFASLANPVLASTLAKYEYQFGSGGIADALRVARSYRPVDISNIDAPLLAFVGASEDEELRIQGKRVYCDVS